MAPLSIGMFLAVCLFLNYSMFSASYVKLVFSLRFFSILNGVTDFSQVQTIFIIVGVRSFSIYFLWVQAGTIHFKVSQCASAFLVQFYHNSIILFFHTKVIFLKLYFMFVYLAYMCVCLLHGGQKNRVAVLNHHMSDRNHHLCPLEEKPLNY